MCFIGFEQFSETDDTDLGSSFYNWGPFYKRRCKIVIPPLIIMKFQIHVHIYLLSSMIRWSQRKMRINFDLFIGIGIKV